MAETFAYPKISSQQHTFFVSIAIQISCQCQLWICKCRTWKLKGVLKCL
jgi:hypothetical protein